MFTVIVCITFVVVGIVGAMKMEDHLTPRPRATTPATTPADGAATAPAQTRAPLDR